MRCKELFNTVLDCKAPVILNYWANMNQNDCPISTAPFSVEEVDTVVQKLKRNESLGQHLITAEMYKAMGDRGRDMLCNMIHKIWAT